MCSRPTIPNCFVALKRKQSSQSNAATTFADALLKSTELKIQVSMQMAQQRNELQMKSLEQGQQRNELLMMQMMEEREPKKRKTNKDDEEE